MDYKNWNPPKGQLEFVLLKEGTYGVKRCINGIPVEDLQPERLNPETQNDKCSYSSEECFKLMKICSYHDEMR
jgi:hypothetical protein